MEITITRALAELKLLDSRITRKILETKFVGYAKKSSPKIGNETKESFIANAKADVQSIESLIERRKLIKSAIVASNATTTITINGVQMTVADTIERKDAIKYDKLFLDTLEKQFRVTAGQANMENTQVQLKLDALLNTSFGKERKDGDTEMKQVTETYLSANEVELVDPLKIDAKIKGLKDSVEDFLMNVDFLLSESNSITKITVPD